MLEIKKRPDNTTTPHSIREKAGSCGNENEAKDRKGLAKPATSSNRKYREKRETYTRDRPNKEDKNERNCGPRIDRSPRHHKGSSTSA
jgi:hypothetical protein